MIDEYGDGIERAGSGLRIACNPRRPEVGSNGRTVYRKNPVPYSITVNDQTIELTAAEARDLAQWLQAFLIRTGPQVQ
jgi:hypothetical protein